jgi:uncharacterized repeat protein (TIGR03803 family)
MIANFYRAPLMARRVFFSLLNRKALGLAALFAVAQLVAATASAAPPTLTSLNPNEDYVTGGAKVTVLGTGFSTATSVKFGSVTGGLSVISDTEIEATVPARAAGRVDIVVTSPDGSSAKTAASKFRYLPLPTKTTIYKFRGGADAARPRGALVADSAGNLYGVTSEGGRNGKGTVFMLSPPVAPATAWKRTILHHFPNTTGLLSVGPSQLFITNRGVLYGMTRRGAAGSRGTVYRLTPPEGAGPWTYELLYTFPALAGDAGPDGGLVRDQQNGVVYGIVAAGFSGFGEIFELTPQRTPPWGYRTLHTFTGAPNGAVGDPLMKLLLRDGSLIGTSYTGGANSHGAVFRYKLATDTASGRFSLLYSFEGQPDGENPVGGIAAGADGTLYGATAQGGTNNNGTVFRLTPRTPPSTRYSEKQLLSFSTSAPGNNPSAGVVLDSKGALFGTTEQGGMRTSGTVFKLTPPAGGQSEWTHRILHSFRGSADGAVPAAELVLKNGAVYGTTRQGGTACSCGTVFMITE